MNRLSWNLILAALLVVCALSLVTSQYGARRLFVDLERAQAEERRIRTEWDQLQLDQTTWSKHSLIEEAARTQLGMKPVTPDKTLYLDLPRAGPALGVDPGVSDKSQTGDGQFSYASGVAVGGNP